MAFPGLCSFIAYECISEQYSLIYPVLFFFFALYKACRIFFMCVAVFTQHILLWNLSSLICFLLCISVSLFYSQWAFGLFPIAGYYEQCCYERLCTYIHTWWACTQVSLGCICRNEIFGSEHMSVFVFTRQC